MKKIMSTVLALSISATAFAGTVTANVEQNGRSSLKGGLSVQTEESIPVLIEKLRRLPPAETLQVLAAAQQNVLTLQREYLSLQNKIIAVQQKPTISDKQLVYKLSLDARRLGLIMMTGTTVVNFFRFFNTEEQAMVNQFTKITTKEAGFFWISAFIAGAAHVSRKLVEHDLTLNNQELALLKSQIQETINRISKQEELISTLQKVFELDVQMTTTTTTQSTVQSRVNAN